MKPLLQSVYVKEFSAHSNPVPPCVVKPKPAVREFVSPFGPAALSAVSMTRILRLTTLLPLPDGSHARTSNVRSPGWSVNSLGEVQDVNCAASQRHVYVLSPSSALNHIFTVRSCVSRNSSLGPYVMVGLSSSTNVALGDQSADPQHEAFT